MKVHILGGSGFLGTRIIPLLIAGGDVVTGTARSAAAAARLRDVGAEPIAGDLLVDEDIQTTIAASGASALITSVSLGFGFGPQIVAAAERAGIRRAVFVSTTSIHTTLDSAAKPIRQEAERAIENSSIDWTIIRPTMIYGAPDDKNMVRLLRLVARTPVVPLPGGGRGLQQPVHVDDLATVIVASLHARVAIHKAYDVAGPATLSFRRVVAAAGDAMGRRVITFPVPLWPVIALTRLYERRGGSLRAEQFERLSEDKTFDITPARQDLGFDPRPFEEGIREEARSLQAGDR